MNETELVEALGTAIAGKAFDFFARYLLSGATELVDAASSEFSRAESVFAKHGLVSEANVARSLRRLLPMIVRYSIWTNLAPVGLNRAKWSRYLKLLARGVGSDIYRGRSVSELWPSQLTAVQHDLFD